jgi:hypothetical protein
VGEGAAMVDATNPPADDVLAKVNTQEGEEPGKKPAWIESGEANLIFGLMILINAFAIGLETDNRDPYNADLKWDVVEWLFLVIFTVEMMLRMRQDKFKYFYDGWNVFDFVLVSSGYVSLFLMNVVLTESDGSGDSVVGMLTTLRTVRLLRLCRVLRLFRFFQGAVDLGTRDYPSNARLGLGYGPPPDGALHLRHLHDADARPGPSHVERNQRRHVQLSG